MRLAFFFRITALVLSLVTVAFGGCTAEEDVPTPAKARIARSFEVPAEVLTIMTQEQLNTFKSAGMPIHEGLIPPQIVQFISSTTLIPAPLTFSMQYFCIHDNKNKANVNTRYDDLAEDIQIFFDARNNKYSVGARYASPLDNGSGIGAASGSGDDFSVFFRVDNGVVNGIPYKAVWVVSGTLVYGSNEEIVGVRDMHAGFEMLEKETDPDDKAANPGTIRIFRDPDGNSERTR